jgi:signal transduction histidine kinase
MSTAPQPDALDLRFLANFIHQVVNPLNGVIGTLDNIIDGTVPSNKRQQRLEAVRAQLEYSVMLIRNLGYFTEASLGAERTTITVPPKLCVIPQLVIEAALFFQEAGLSQGVTIHLEDRETQYVVRGSPDLLRQAFMNLFDNAVKYSDPNTTVSVRPWVQKSTNHLIVEVRNNGAGFRNDEAPLLFQLGYRSEEAAKRIAAGTGLGLFICQRILRDVGATIEAEYSKQNREATFRIRFAEWEMR